jgi:hypothetical protein
MIVIGGRSECWKWLRSASLAALGCMLALATLPGSAAAQFGVSTFSSSFSSQQAGAHADFSTSFSVEDEELGNPEQQLDDTSVTLPPGAIGNPLAVERCSPDALREADCAPASQVGVLELTAISCQGTKTTLTAAAEAGATQISVANAKSFCGEQVTVGEGALAESASINSVVNASTIELTAPLVHSHEAGEPVKQLAKSVTLSSPLFNTQPSRGDVATLGSPLFVLDIYVQVSLGEDGRLVAGIDGATTLLSVAGAKLTLWGVPSSPSHDAQRCRELEAECGRSVPEGPPFMTNPTSCGSGQLLSQLTVVSWQGATASASAQMPPMTGCEALALAPSIHVSASTDRRDSPAGYELDLSVPQEESASELATPALERVTVTLPSGTSLSPGLANGLQTCEPSQVATGCPDASRVGSAEVDSPLLALPLAGSLYIGTPTPIERYPLLLRLIGTGVALTVHGQVQPDEGDGQVHAVFEDLPELPLSSMRLSFFGGPGAALANPPTCGSATSTAVFTSYAGQEASVSSTFEVDEDSGGGPCPAVSPFAPSFAAGTLDPAAGQTSPFVLSIARSDGEQSLSSFTVNLPSGLIGLVGSVSRCEEPLAARGACVPASKIGTAKVAAGPGQSQLALTGSVYLTGPYDGAPFGLEIAIPAVAGPFEFGTILVRSRVLLSSSTLAMTIESGALPQSVGGVPLRLRTIEVELNRPGFISNPTSCGRQAITGTIHSAQAANAAVSAPFDTTGCESIGFAPKVKASTGASASREGTGAGLNIAIDDPRSDGTFSSVSIQMPPRLRPRLTAIRDACLLTGSTNVSSCPSNSVVGVATVRSPVVNSSLRGSVHLVSHGGRSSPDLSVHLYGEGIEVDLEGAIRISRKNVISVTFADLPDVPISSLELTLPPGPHSLLGAVASLCAPLRLSYKATDHATGVAKGTVAISTSGCRRGGGKQGSHLASGSKARSLHG